MWFWVQLRTISQLIDWSGRGLHCLPWVLYLICEEFKDRLLGVETRTDALKRSTPSPAFGGAFLSAAANRVCYLCADLWDATRSDYATTLNQVCIMGARA